MSKAAAEAIRTMIRDGSYTGWTGEDDTDTKDYFMCCALEKNYPEDCGIARDFIEDTLHTKGDTSCLRNLFAKYDGEDVPFSSKRSSKYRKKALTWFEDIAAQLEALEN